MYYYVRCKSRNVENHKQRKQCTYLELILCILNKTWIIIMLKDVAMNRVDGPCKLTWSTQVVSVLTWAQGMIKRGDTSMWTSLSSHQCLFILKKWKIITLNNLGFTFPVYYFLMMAIWAATNEPKFFWPSGKIDKMKLMSKFD